MAAADSRAKRRLLLVGRGRVDPLVRRTAAFAASARHRSHRGRGRCARSSPPPAAPPMMPSLSVVQTVPSRRRKEAPALSSPDEPQPAVEQAVDEPLEADRHFMEPCVPSLAATQSIMLLDTAVLPTAAAGVPLGPVRKQIVNARGEIVVRRAAARRSWPRRRDGRDRCRRRTPRRSDP